MTLPRDLSSWLQFANASLAVLACTLFLIVGANVYVDAVTLLLCLLFAAENILLLQFGKRRKDPFLVVLLFVATFFYVGRVPTLLLDPWAQVFSRYHFCAGELNHALFFVLVSNLVIALGLCIGGKSSEQASRLPGYAPGNRVVVAAIFAFAILCNYFLLPMCCGHSRLSSYASGVLLNMGMILLLTITYLVINWSGITKVYSLLIAALFFCFTFFSMVQGSRAAFLGLFLVLGCAALARNGEIIFTRRSAIVTFVMLLYGILSFFMATYVRSLGYTPTTMITAERVQFLETFQPWAVGVGGQPLWRTFLDRIGYLTYSAEIISGENRYKGIISPKYYCKSLVDNLLTPGFYVFDTPKVANALRYIYLGIKPSPTHRDVAREYHSDMLTAYGESYVLFRGYWALLLLFIISFAFARAYSLVRFPSEYMQVLSKALLLLLFHNWINSFGLDWMALEIVKYCIPILLLSRFYWRPLASD